MLNIRQVPAGAVYDTNSRKGPLTLRLVTPANYDDPDNSFDAEIVEGKARFMSSENNFLQKNEGLGTRGDVLRFRTSLVTLLKHRPELEHANDPARTKPSPTARGY